MDASHAVSPVIELLFRGVCLQGRLHRLSLTLLAEAGANLAFEATAFVPAQHEEEGWGDMPSISGVLWRVFWNASGLAIDPVTENLLLWLHWLTLRGQTLVAYRNYPKGSETFSVLRGFSVSERRTRADAPGLLACVVGVAGARSVPVVPPPAAPRRSCPWRGTVP